MLYLNRFNMFIFIYTSNLFSKLQKIKDLLFYRRSSTNYVKISKIFLHSYFMYSLQFLNINGSLKDFNLKIQFLKFNLETMY